jgi:hypothetical protein
MTFPFKSRSQYSGIDLVSDLRLYNPHFKNFCRMFPSGFDDKLMKLVGPKIMRKTQYYEALFL